MGTAQLEIDRAKLFKSIDIRSKGMTCSLVLNDVVYVGCRDGHLIEFSNKTFEI